MKNKYKIYCDMDGVLVDFNRAFEKLSNGVYSRTYEEKHGKKAFWDLISKEGAKFWSEMHWTKDGKKLWDYINHPTTELLSAPSQEMSSRVGKARWVGKNLPGVILNLELAKDKKLYASPNNILIDDHPLNISDWINEGGIGVLHTSAKNTIEQLKKLYNE